MITSNSMPSSDVGKSQSQALPTTELINRLASEMRAVGDRDLPLSFYAEQVKRRLANEAAANANDGRVKLTRAPAAATSSVFHCWALSEKA
ncbi:hypothetical protein RMR21_010490 [Agrobacterium sp. rho-8.1]|nr:hypothetical protein [Agrobacterium sp. rho-8.1]